MDTTLKITKILDTSKYDYTGARTPIKRYTFFLGGLGPFVEDVDVSAGFDPSAFDRQIAPLIAHIQSK